MCKKPLLILVLVNEYQMFQLLFLKGLSKVLIRRKMSYPTDIRINWADTKLNPKLTQDGAVQCCLCIIPEPLKHNHKQKEAAM